MSYAVDFPADGQTDGQGQLPVVKDLQALNNAIKLWLGSFRGERLYHPAKGGPIVGYLLKPMSEESAEDMKFSITQGLLVDFTPSVTVTKCEVIPNYELKQYEVVVVGYCSALNSDVYYQDSINSLRN
jgi:hypothetical protein